MTLALTAAQIEALRSLNALLAGRPVVLIGATALQAYVDLRRTTRDVDVIVVATLAEIPEALEGEWTKDPKVPHRWRREGDQVADVLPADAETVAKQKLQFPGDDRVLNMVGIDLAVQHVQQVEVEGLQISVAALPVLVVLKMIAWLDRPAERARDLGDVILAMRNGLADDDDRRFDEPISTANLSWEQQSPWHVGFEVGRIVRAAEAELVRGFLHRVRGEDRDFAEMLRESRIFASDREEQVSTLLTAFVAGFEAGLAAAEAV